MINAGELMTESVILFKANQNASSAVEKLDKKNVGGAPVVDDDMNVIGIFSRSDYTEEDEGKPVGDLMSSPAITVNEDTSIEQVAILFMSKNINRLPVVKEGKLVGIVARLDLIAYLANVDAWKEIR